MKATKEMEITLCDICYATKKGHLKKQTAHYVCYKCKKDLCREHVISLRESNDLVKDITYHYETDFRLFSSCSTRYTNVHVANLCTDCLLKLKEELKK